MANECVPFFLPGDEITCAASGAITGCRFVASSGAADAEGKPKAIHPAASGDVVFGVAARDTATTEAVMVYKGNQVVPVLCSGAMAAGALVMAEAATGKAIAAAGAGKWIAGQLMDDVADAALGMVNLGIKGRVPA